MYPGCCCRAAGRRPRTQSPGKVHVPATHMAERGNETGGGEQRADADKGRKGQPFDVSVDLQCRAARPLIVRGVQQHAGIRMFGGAEEVGDRRVFNDRTGSQHGNPMADQRRDAR